MPDHPFSNPAYRQATILLANENFGSGSSREHAPQALKRWGIDACVAESFSEIFQGNSLAIGLPCATAAHSDIEAVMTAIEEAPDTELAVSVSGLTLQVAERRITLHIPAGVRKALLSGYWGCDRPLARSVRGGRGGRRPTSVCPTVRGQLASSTSVPRGLSQPQETLLPRGSSHQRIGRSDERRAAVPAEGPSPHGAGPA